MLIRLAQSCPFPPYPTPLLHPVQTTLTTVGFGDVVATTLLGKMVVVGMICVGVVLIPVQVGAWQGRAAGQGEGDPGGRSARGSTALSAPSAAWGPG